MDEVFASRVRAAAASAWWTFVVAAAFLLFQWFIYLGVMSAKPAFALTMWGPDATWDGIRTPWLQALVLAKLGLWLVLIAAVWLTLWARRLRTVRGDR